MDAKDTLLMDLFVLEYANGDVVLWVAYLSYSIDEKSRYSYVEEQIVYLIFRGMVTGLVDA